MKRVIMSLLLINCLFLLESCHRSGPLAPSQIARESKPDYLIGPGDSLNVFIWRNPELSTTVPVRPDGKMTMPLVEDMHVSGMTASKVARKLEAHLQTYLQDPMVTVIVSGFVGPYDQQVRILGEATSPKALNYKENMTLLDAMIEVGGISDNASGNNSLLSRNENGQQVNYRIRIEDLVKDGDISANVDLLPGDIVIIPESFF